jgi:hypothetical protein
MDKPIACAHHRCHRTLQFQEVFVKGTVKVVDRITARSERIEETASLLWHLASESRKEDVCTFYEVLQDQADRSVFVLAGNPDIGRCSVVGG